jgi:hypothetical protein
LLSRRWHGLIGRSMVGLVVGLRGKMRFLKGGICGMVSCEVLGGKGNMRASCASEPSNTIDHVGGKRS